MIRRTCVLVPSKVCLAARIIFIRSRLACCLEPIPENHLFGQEAAPNNFLSFALGDSRILSAHLSRDELLRVFGGGSTPIFGPLGRDFWRTRESANSPLLSKGEKVECPN